MLFLLNAIFGMFGIVWAQAAADSLTVVLSFYVLWKYKPSAREQGEKRAVLEGRR